MLEMLIFWAWFVVPVVILLIAVANESIAWATLVTVITLAVWWLAGVLVLGTLWANLGTLLVWSALYLAIGCVLGGFDFWLLCRDALAVFKRDKEAKAKERWVDQQTRGWASYQAFTKSEYGVPLWASEHKELISTWVFFWPWKAVSRLFGNYLLRAVKAIVRWVAGLYQRISDTVFRDLTP